ncbi:uncharacterized protein LOC126767405 [Bactrocera neohumeralis]|uniref:uncharacterized protein LOC126767405 n=1 Tax=Bactrocera neohumeralis TaxID=98809 RepID=UPI0021663B7C|nr:uncharacterized protein LOC126767405 [Bactrocera neohumeralis]
MGNTVSDEILYKNRTGGGGGVSSSSPSVISTCASGRIDSPEYNGGSSSFLQEMVLWARQNHHRLPKESDVEGGMELVPSVTSLRHRLNALKDVLRTYGRTALILSGGASMGTYHTGVVRALYEAGVLPDIMSGSSAGSIIAAIICTKSSKDLKKLIEVDLLSTEVLRLTPFGQDASLVQKVKRLFKTGFLMDVRSLMECIRDQCGDMTFLEAYKLSGRVLNITVTRDNQKGTLFDRHVLLNYLTAPHVVIWSAVSASSALPGLFTAVQLIEKAPSTGFFQPYLPGELYCDGSVAQDIRATALPSSST